MASTVQGAGDTKKVKKSSLCQEGLNILAKVEITEILFLFLNMGELKKNLVVAMMRCLIIDLHTKIEPQVILRWC